MLSPFDFGLIFLGLCLTIGIPLAVIGGKLELIRDQLDRIRMHADRRNALLSDTVEFQREGLRMQRASSLLAAQMAEEVRDNMREMREELES